MSVAIIGLLPTIFPFYDKVFPLFFDARLQEVQEISALALRARRERINIVWSFLIRLYADYSLKVSAEKLKPGGQNEERTELLCP